MKRVLFSAGTFVSVHLCLAYVLWMGGFDFETRNFFTGYVAFFGVGFGFFAARIVWDELT